MEVMSRPTSSKTPRFALRPPFTPHHFVADDYRRQNDAKTSTGDPCGLALYSLPQILSIGAVRLTNDFPEPFPLKLLIKKAFRSRPSDNQMVFLQRLGDTITTAWRDAHHKAIFLSNPSLVLAAAR